MAVHKGKILRSAPLGGGVRRPRFRVPRPIVQGACFDLLAPRDSRRTIMVRSAVSIRVDNQRSFDADRQCIVQSPVNQTADTWQSMAQAFFNDSATAARVTQSRRHVLDTAFRVSAPRRQIADSAQQIQRVTGCSIDAGLTVFNVIINEQHEIRT